MTETAATRTGHVLTSDQAEIVRATLPAVAANIDAITTGFYQRLFTAHPDLLTDLFNRSNQARGDQARALAASVATWATVLVEDKVEEFNSLGSRIANKHASLGVSRSQYQVVHDHLFASIVDVLGDAVTPAVAEAWEVVYWSLANTLIDAEHHLYADAGVADGDVFKTAVVVERVNHRSGAATFTVVADPDTDGAESNELGSFLPGQYTSVGAVMDDGARQLRQYSLHGRPSRTHWSFTVKRVDGQGDPDGEVSTHLVNRIGVGDKLDVTIPTGDFVLDTTSNTPLVLLSAGVGITPVLGLVNHLAAAQPDRPVQVIQADRDPDSQILGAELAEAAAGLTDARVTFHYETKAEAAAGLSNVVIREGLVDLDHLKIDDWTQVYLCGPQAFLTTCLSRLTARGVGKDRLHFELFVPNDWLVD